VRCRTFAAVLGAALLLLSSASAEPEKARARSTRGAEQAFAVAPAAAESRGQVSQRDRLTVYAYYRAEFVAGHCPGGLVRKSNGCRLLGDARRAWSLGAPVPPLTVFLPLPSMLQSRLQPLPRGYRFVRIDTDVLVLDADTRRITEVVASVADLQDPIWPIVAETDRAVLVRYYRADYFNRTCPPDLTPTRRGCEVKPLWTVGEPLDPLATYELLPERLQAELGPPPDGYRYIRVADHVLLMVVATRIISADLLDLTDLADTYRK
jgi:hypothetical protein